MCLVRAKEIRRSGLYQWNVRTLRAAAMQQTAVDALQVHDTRVLAQVVGRVDPL